VTEGIKTYNKRILKRRSKQTKTKLITIKDTFKISIEIRTVCVIEVSNQIN